MLEPPANQLIALTTALEAAGLALTLARRVPAPLTSLADQVVRSASSVAANLSEGHGRSGRDRLHRWRIAYASAKEVDTHLRLLAGAGAVDVGRARAASTSSTRSVSPDPEPGSLRRAVTTNGHPGWGGRRTALRERNGELTSRC